MRVCLDARFIDYAGIGRFVTDLWGALAAQNDIELIALAPEDARVGWLSGASRDRPAESIPVRSRPFGPSEQIALPSLLRRSRSSVYHSPNLTVPYLSRTPIVLTVHGVYPLIEPSHVRSRPASLYNRVMFPLSVRKATIVVAISEFAAGEMREHLKIPEERLRVVPHGLDLRKWRPSSEGEIEQVLTARKITTPYLLYSGTAKVHKNLGLLAEMYRRVDDLPLLIMAGPTADELREVWPDPPAESRVRPLGRVPDHQLPALYSGALALLIPSFYETSPYPVLEAMACGTPVVGSTRGGTPSTLGSAGLLVGPNDPDGWIDAVRSLVDDEKLRARFAQAGVARMSHQRIDTAARKYIDVYREAVDLAWSD